MGLSSRCLPSTSTRTHGTAPLSLRAANSWPSAVNVCPRSLSLGGGKALFEESGQAFVVPLAQKVRLEHRLVGKRRLKPAGSRSRSD